MYIHHDAITEKPRGRYECVDMLRDVLQPKVNHFEDVTLKKPSGCNLKSLEL